MHSEKDHSLIEEIRDDIQLGDLAPDGGQYRPAIVWFEEPVPKISEAIPIVSNADLFAVIGTSLVVYPAAGLVHYAAGHIPKFIVDKSIPYIEAGTSLTTIEKPATEGMIVLKEKLAAYR